MSKKIKVKHIITLQSNDDIELMLENFETDCISNLSEDDMITYLSQWEQCDSESDITLHRASDVDTNFLGELYDDNYLLNIDYSLECVSLSRIIGNK